MRVYYRTPSIEERGRPTVHITLSRGEMVGLIHSLQTEKGLKLICPTKEVTVVVTGETDGEALMNAWKETTGEEGQGDANLPAIIPTTDSPG